MQKGIFLLFVRDLSFNQNLNAATSNCSYAFLIFTSTQLSHKWELMYNSKGSGVAFTGIFRGDLCWVQGKPVPTCIRENSEKSSASVDHCSSHYQISLLDLALQGSREDTAAETRALLLDLVENWEASKPGCQASHLWKLGTWLHQMEIMVRGRAKWRLELVNPNCKVLCHATSTEIGGLTL